ncbi:MAG: hydroxyacylglutathione hydrolase [Myxococcales bacterium]|nr:hydroxyacylglutathione hydrolase [Myxococcales bacterium]
MQVVPVPCLKDNYAYLVIEGGSAAVVDPSEAAPVEAALAKAGVALRAIWATHHHWDHTGGIADLVAAHPGIEVVIGEADAEKVKHITRTVSDGEEIEFGSHRVRVIHNPGHTLGAVTYLVDGNAFTGDTLFCAGCGRVFEGTPQMMHESLMKLAHLPGDTKIWCGHEYTASNLRFAAAVEPDNKDVAARLAALTTPSVPATMAVERATNPFLRDAQPSVIASARAQGLTSDEPWNVFAQIREWKNNFK